MCLLSNCRPSYNYNLVFRVRPCDFITAEDRNVGCVSFYWTSFHLCSRAIREALASPSNRQRLLWFRALRLDYIRIFLCSELRYLWYVFVVWLIVSLQCQYHFFTGVLSSRRFQLCIIKFFISYFLHKVPFVYLFCLTDYILMLLFGIWYNRSRWRVLQFAVCRLQ